jgi:hypothetical protein
VHVENEVFVRGREASEQRAAGSVGGSPGLWLLW